MSDEPTPQVEGTRWTKGRIFGLVWGIGMAAGLVLLLVLGLARQGDDRKLSDQVPIDNPEPAPDFTLPVLFPGGSITAGSQVTLSSLRGKPVVVNLWASWCVECRGEAPLLEDIWQQHKAAGVIVLGVDTQDDPDDALAFIAEHKTTFPSVRDGTDKTQSAYGTSALPETFVVDAEGKVRLIYRGAINRALADEISDFLDTLTT